MQGILSGRHDDEVYLLGLALTNADLVTRTTDTIEKVIETWSDQPADFVILVRSGILEDAVLEVHNIRSVLIAPLILITDPLPEGLQIKLFKAGLDLIINRPYSLQLLPYQIKPLLLRTNIIPLRSLPDLVHPAIRLDNKTRSAIVGDGLPVHLTQLEYRLLYSLMVRRGETLSAEEIVNQVWGYNGEENRELVRGLIQRLRAKIEPDPQNPRFILTEPGRGYLFEPLTVDK